MFSGFRKPQPPPSEEAGDTQPPTHGIQPWYKQPDLTKARTTTELGGQRPPVVNLRDHPELDGIQFAVVHYELHQGAIDGEPTEFVIMAGFTIDANQKPVSPMAIMTGAGDVLARIYQFRDAIDNGTPVIGTFRNSGRAWFFD